MISQFKAGDWVCNDSSLFKIVLTKINGSFVKIHTNKPVEETDWYDAKIFTPWHPQEGEYCWFIFDLSKELKYELGQFDLINYDECIPYYGSKQHNKFFEYCEPFIGELPTFLKDK